MTLDHFEKPLMLTSELPTSMTIRTTQTAVEVKIVYNQTTIFQTTLYTYNGKAVFSCFRDIIEDYMIQHYATSAKVAIDVYDGKDNDGMQESTLIFCRHRLSTATKTFCTTHFLTLADTFLLPRGCDFTVPFYLAEDEISTPTYDCVLLPEGSTTPVVKSYEPEESEEEGEDTSSEGIYYDSIMDDIKEKYPDLATAKLLAVTVHRGARSLTIYYTDEQPVLHLKCRAAFNAWTDFYLFGALTTKTDMSRTEAVCLNTAQFYDESLDLTFEFETSFLTPDEALYLNQLLTSPQVYLMTTPKNFANQEILITDITSEITTDPTETNRIKFTFKYRNPTQLHYPAESPGIFTEPYNPTFQ